MEFAKEHESNSNQEDQQRSISCEECTGIPKECETEPLPERTYLTWNKEVPDSNMKKFQKYIESKYKLEFDSYWDLHSWSIQNTDTFWSEIWQYFDIVSSKSYDKAFVQTGPGYLDNEWFVGSRLNFAENLLREIDSEDPVVYQIDEEGLYEYVTYVGLHSSVQRYASGFRNIGMKKGDVVCCYINNTMDVVTAILACASIGALWAAIPPFYEAEQAAKLVEKIEPNYFYTTEDFQSMGKRINLLDRIPTIIANAPTIRKVMIDLVIPERFKADISHIPNSCLMVDMLDDIELPDGSCEPLVFEQLPFDHPLFLNFTSETIDEPKGFVHGAGTLVPLLVDAILHWNLKPGDIIFSQFPAGCAVYNWFLPCIAQGVRLLFYNGHMLHTKNGSNIWNIISQNECSCMFIEPEMLVEMEKKNIVPNSDANLEKLKIIVIPASSVPVHVIKFVKEKVKNDIFVGSLYGNNTSYGCFTGFDWNLPSYGAEYQVPALGKDIKCLDAEGHPVANNTVGNLVLTNRSPPSPLCVWKDQDGNVLKKAYLDKYPGMWFTGDTGCVNSSTKGLTVLSKKQ